jgi:hypothetical protein
MEKRYGVTVHKKRGVLIIHSFIHSKEPALVFHLHIHCGSHCTQMLLHAAAAAAVA